MDTVIIPFSSAAFLLTEPLRSALDAATLGRLREALATNLAQCFASTPRHVFSLEGSIMPPKPFLNAGFAIRIRWSTWFMALSPSGRPLLLTVDDDRKQTLSAAETPRLHTTVSTTTSRFPPGHARTFTPTPQPTQDADSSLSGSSPERSSSLSSKVQTTHALTSTPSRCTLPHPERGLCDAAVETPIEPGQVRRPRRQRGGVKQKQRGIRIDKSKLDATHYLHAGGVTGTLTGGVMLGRHARSTSTVF